MVGAALEGGLIGVLLGRDENVLLPAGLPIAPPHDQAPVVLIHSEVGIGAGPKLHGSAGGMPQQDQAAALRHCLRRPQLQMGVDACG